MFVINRKKKYILDGIIKNDQIVITDFWQKINKKINKYASKYAAAQVLR